MHSDDVVKEAATHKLHNLGTDHLARLSNITINVALNYQGVLYAYDVYFEKMGSDHRVATWTPVRVIKVTI